MLRVLGGKNAIQVFRLKLQVTVKAKPVTSVRQWPLRAEKVQRGEHTAVCVCAGWCGITWVSLRLQSGVVAVRAPGSPCV
jgi:hypothetical protein